MNNKNSVKRNYIYNLVYQIFLLIVPLLVTPYIARVLGSDGSGRYAFSYSVVTYFTLFANIGFSYYSQRYISRLNDDKKINSISFWEIFLARLIPTVLTCIVYIILIGFNFFGSYQVLMEILIINVISCGFDISFFYQGKEDFKKIVIRNVVIKSLSIISIFIFVKENSDLWIYTLIQSLTVFFSNISLWTYLPKDLCKVRFSELKPIKHLWPALLLFIPAIATTIYTSLDKTMITLITGDESQTGNYDYADKFVKIALTVISSLGTVMISRNSKLLSQDNFKIFKDNLNKTCVYVFLAGFPMMFGLIAISDNLIPWYLGEGYNSASDILKILSPLVLIIGFSSIFGLQCLIPLGKDKKFTIAIVAGALINCLFNFLFIYLFGVYGAAIATIIAETCVTIIMFIFCRKYVSVSFIFKKSWKYFAASLIMFGICFLESFYFRSSVLFTLLIAFTGITIYLFLLILLRDEITLMYTRKFFDFARTFIRKIKRKKQ